MQVESEQKRGEEKKREKKISFTRKMFRQLLSVKNKNLFKKFIQSSDKFQLFIKINEGKLDSWAMLYIIAG